MSSAADCLRTELLRVATKLAECAFTPHDESGEPTVPNLLRIAAKRSSDLSRDDPKRAVLALLREAIDLLPKTTVHYAKTVTWRQFGLGLYNLAEDTLDHMDGKRYSRLRDDVFKGEVDLPPKKTRDNWTRELRQRLATILLDIEVRHDQLAAADAGEIIQDGYVSRPEIQSEVLRLFQNGTLVVLLHGDAGTGKTTTAKAIARHLLADTVSEVHIVHAATQDALEHSLYDLLAKLDGSCRDASLPAMQHQFRRLIAGSNAPKAVVIDNVDETLEGVTLLQRLLPALPASHVMVTSRRHLKFSRGSFSSVVVGNMQSEHARSLVRLHTKDLSDDDLSRLAEVLDFRPLAIKHGCAVLNDYPYRGKVDDFCASFRRSAQAILSSNACENDVTLVAIYTETIRQLAKHPAALKLLDLIIFAAPTHPFRSTVILLWPSTDSDTDGELLDEDRLVINDAILYLENRMLIDSNAPICIHRLTKELIAAQRKEAIGDSIGLAVERLLKRIKFDSWPGGRPFPSNWPHLHAGLTHLYRVKQISLESAEKFMAATLRELRAGCPGNVLRLSIGGYIHRELKTGRLPSEALLREVVELGYIDDIARVQGKSWMNDARRRVPDIFVHEAYLSSEFHPLRASHNFEETSRIGKKEQDSTKRRAIGWESLKRDTLWELYTCRNQCGVELWRS